MKDLAQKFEQRKQNYSTPQITTASKLNETEVYSVGRLLHEVIFSFVLTRKTKEGGFGNYTKSNEIKISVSLKVDTNT